MKRALLPVLCLPVLCLPVLCLLVVGCRKRRAESPAPPAPPVPALQEVQRLEPTGLYDGRQVAAGETVADPAFADAAAAVREKLSTCFPEAQFGIGWDSRVLHVTVYGIPHEKLAAEYLGLGGKPTNLSADIARLCVTTEAPYTEALVLCAKRTDRGWFSSHTSWRALKKEPAPVFGRQLPPGLPRGHFFADPEYLPAAKALLAVLQEQCPEADFAISWNPDVLHVTTYASAGQPAQLMASSSLAALVEGPGVPASENLMLSSCGPQGTWTHEQVPWPKRPSDMVVQRPASPAGTSAQTTDSAADEEPAAGAGGQH